MLKLSSNNIRATNQVISQINQQYKLMFNNDRCKSADH